MARALIVGSTGLVGSKLLQLLQDFLQVTAIVAPTRAAAAAQQTDQSGGR